MPNTFKTLPLLAIAGLLVVSSGAYGATIDTFNFIEPNVYENGAPAGGQTFEFAGSFTGAVEASGFIEQADLSAFTVQLADSNGNPIPQYSMGLSSLTLFSFDANGGASSLDFAGTPEIALSNFCVGAATALDAACTFNFGYTYPVGTVGVLLLQGPADLSSSFPQITLVSSVTTPPSSAAPEPPFTLALGILLLAGGAGISRFLRGCGVQHALRLPPTHCLRPVDIHDVRWALH